MKSSFLKTETTKDSLVTVADFISEEMESNAIPIKEANKISIALDEMYSNVVNYSNATEAEIYCDMDSNSIKVTIRDNGNPFNPLQKENPDIHQSAQDRKEGGLGIFITKKLMSSLTYTYEDSYNCLIMELKIKDVEK